MTRRKKQKSTFEQGPPVSHCRSCSRIVPGPEIEIYTLIQRHYWGVWQECINCQPLEERWIKKEEG